MVKIKDVSSNLTNNQDQLSSIFKERYDLHQLVLANTELIEIQHEEQLKKDQHLQALVEDVEQKKKLIKTLEAQLAACQCSHHGHRFIQAQQTYNQMQPIQPIIIHQNAAQIQQHPQQQFINQQQMQQPMQMHQLNNQTLEHGSYELVQDLYSSYDTIKMCAPENDFSEDILNEY